MSEESTVVLANCPKCKTTTFCTRVGNIVQCFKCNEIYSIKK